jgi:hypothetical protein
MMVKYKLWNLMVAEGDLVKEYCGKKDWEETAKWLHKNKATFKAYRRVCKLEKNDT